MKLKTEIILYILVLLVIPILLIINYGWDMMKEILPWLIWGGFIFLIGTIAYFISKHKDKKREEQRNEDIKKYNDTKAK